MKKFWLMWASIFVISACMSKSNSSNNSSKITAMDTNNGQYEIITFGAGCFWCVEAVFQRLEGVVKVESGYSGGEKPNPTYKQVASGNTKYAEVCQVTYDPKVISFKELLEVFFTTHDPTTLNRQGNDVGPQYRSAIFYHTAEQKEQATYYINKLNEEKAYKNPVVTEVTPYKNFYMAEDYHQNYYNNNQSQPYCSYVIQPKVEKLRKVFGDKLKETATN